jgi:U2-associated protein SR140
VTRARGFLGPAGQKKMLWLLRRLDLRRGAIARTMGYVVERADAAEEIVDLIVASLVGGGEVGRKVARLYLVSDILHNSSSGRTNVWKYRQLYPHPFFLLVEADDRFEAKLGVVFEHLHSVYASFDGRIKADHFRRQVMAVTAVWETWMIFNNANVEAWVKTFLGRVEDEAPEEEVEEEIVETVVEKKARWKKVAETSGKEAKDVGGYTSPVGSGDEGEEDVDGEVMGEEGDVDGEPMEEEDVDGEPMDDDVDGEPMDDDVDGMPMDEESESAPAHDPTPEPPVDQTPDDPRPVKRQRMKAADMFAD